MKIDRDPCWLKEAVFTDDFKTYSIEGNDQIIATIRDELSLLFPAVQEVASQGDLAFVLVEEESLGEEGYAIEKKFSRVIVKANFAKGLLYGFYYIYRQVRQKQTLESTHSIPDQSFRMINHWDNMDGSIERGYAGDSIFYKDNTFRRDYDLVRQYARLLASVGINALSINNVNVHEFETRLILESSLPDVKMLNDIFSSYGIKTFLSINFATPKKLGGLQTADPLNQEVIDFWETTIAKIYQIIPDFGGFVVKADSEGEPGPFAYGRGHDEGANLFGRILGEYGGLCIWRCFVYDCAQDWRDRSIDRARAAYDHFLPLDGKFDDNVILQIKLGALDFQVIEPLSPLFGALRHTNQIIEFQLTQEYTGQQRAIYYQVPVWKEVLDFDTKYEYEPSVVKELLKTNSVNPKLSGICAVGVVGMDDNWTHHKLMQSNIYAYGRLCWDNELSSETIAEEWSKLTFSISEEAHKKVVSILTTSRETYRLYNAPNGVGFMCKPNVHYGPSIDGYEYDRWGTYHFADRNGIGNNRTVTGTKYVEQYSPARCQEYNNIATCPDELLLWFHHVPYEHVLQNGKMLIQDIYDNHFMGVQRVADYQAVWESLAEEMDTTSFENVRELLEEQYAMAIEWRDQVNTYFYRKSGVADEQGRRIYE